MTSNRDRNHLDSIVELLTAAHELMMQDRTFDRDAFEYLRRLMVKVRFAIRAASTVEDGLVPEKAPARWQDRENREEGPVEFIKRVYAPYLGKGICRADIRRLDKKLYDILNVWIARHGEIPDIALPTKKELIDKRLEAIDERKSPSRMAKMTDLPPVEQERLRLFNTARRRKERARQLQRTTR